MTPLDWTIDEDIRRASTLPAEVYGDPRWLATMRDRVFARSWQLVADTDAVRVPGATHPVTLLEGMLDEPLVLTRDTQDELHCLSNVCTHRGTLVCEHAAVLPALRCRYHGRRFAHDGRFLSYVWDPARLDRGAGAALDRVEREDEAVVESVPRGGRSRLYHRGRYSPVREQGVHHFHRLLERFLGEG